MEGVYKIHENFLSLDMTNNIVILTIRKEEIRIISARTQSKKERGEYEKK